MEIPTVFLKARSIILCCSVFTNFIWIVSLSFVIFSWWELLDRPQSSLIILMLVANVISAIMLLILLLLPFRTWLDAARVAFLLALHLGIASAFAYSSPKFKCLSRGVGMPEQENTCKVITIYILVASWVFPALLMIYTCGLTVMVWRLSSCLHTPPTISEMIDGRSSNVPVTSLTTQHQSAHPVLPHYDPFNFNPDQFTIDNNQSSHITSDFGKRLSKPAPIVYF